MQRRAAASAEAAMKAVQKTRALLEEQEAAVYALEAALKKSEEEISEIQAELGRPQMEAGAKAAVECVEELLRIAAPTLAEGVDLVAEVGNRGSAVWCEGAGGAASFCGTGRGRRTIPVEAVEVKGFLAGTVECAERSACREDSMRSSPAGTGASLMQAGGEGSLAGTTSTNEADEKFIGVLEQDFAVKVEQATTKSGGPGCGSQLRGQRPAPLPEGLR